MQRVVVTPHNPLDPLMSSNKLGTLQELYNEIDGADSTELYYRRKQLVLTGIDLVSRLSALT